MSRGFSESACPAPFNTRNFINTFPAAHPDPGGGSWQLQITWQLLPVPGRRSPGGGSRCCSVRPLSWPVCLRPRQIYSRCLSGASEGRFCPFLSTPRLILPGSCSRITRRRILAKYLKASPRPWIKNLYFSPYTFYQKPPFFVNIKNDRF